MCLDCAIWKAAGQQYGRSWGGLWVNLGALGANLGALGANLGAQEPNLGALGGFWARLGDPKELSWQSKALSAA